MEHESQVGGAQRDLARIDAALAQLRRLGRPQSSSRVHAESGRGHSQHGGGHHAHHRGHLRFVGLARHRMLSVLEQRPSLGVTEIAEAIGVDQPRASRLVNDAVDAGLIRRSPDPRDGRRSIVELTTAGREHLERTLRERRDAIAAGLEGFSDAETATLADLLERFVDGMRTPPAD